MIPVIFQDDEILVVEKPAGLVTTSSETQLEPSLQDLLAKDFGINIERSGIVHRLDKDTSGLLVVAKTDKSLKALQAQFKGREVKKEYLALVHGILDKSGRVEAAIMRNPSNREKFIAIQPHQTRFDPLRPPLAWLREASVRRASPIKARVAVTEYEPIKSLQFSAFSLHQIFSDFNKIQMRKLERMGYNQFTLLRCFPQTGRTHQIRVHLKYLGFPVVGDDKYGGRKVVRLDHRWVPRQFLHAAHLELESPKTGERMKFDSKLPDDLEKALEVLEKV